MLIWSSFLFFHPLVLTEENMILNQHSVFMTEGTELTEVWHIQQQILPRLLDQCKQVSRTSRNITCSRIWKKLIWSCWLCVFSAHLMLPSNPCISHTLTASILSSSTLSHPHVLKSIVRGIKTAPLYFYLFDHPALALCKLLYIFPAMQRSLKQLSWF